jgi:hypothetical protein
MGWQRRGSQTYFYQPQRSNGRPTNRYIGRGEMAEPIIARLEAERLEKQQAREQLRAAREEIGPLERLVERLDDGAGLLLEATLRAEGFYRQCRKWRGPRHVRYADGSC